MAYSHTGPNFSTTFESPAGLSNHSCDPTGDGERDFEWDQNCYITVTTYTMIHHGENPVECRICNFRTSSNEILTKHQETHGIYRGSHFYTCESCRSSYKSQEAFHAHMKRHEGELETSNGATLKDNPVVETTQRKIPDSEQADEKFIKQSTQKKESKITKKKSNMNAPRPQKTTFAKKTRRLNGVSQSSDDENRKQTHLRRTNNAGEGEIRPFKCTFCAFRSSRLRNLKSHVGTRHGMKKYKCRFCHISHDSEYIMIMHEKCVHYAHGFENACENTYMC